MSQSPYSWIDILWWYNKTLELIKNHPLDEKVIVETVLSCRDDIFTSSLWPDWFKIGTDIFPAPQIMWFLLHELIPLKLKKIYHGMRTKDEEVSDKDLVYIPDHSFSVEIKTSSSKDKIFWNRSYAQESQDPKKDKSWYYICVNFEKFHTDKDGHPIKWEKPKITLIRFWYLDHSDWIWQKAATWQQSRLTQEADKNKLIVLYRGN